MEAAQVQPLQGTKSQRSESAELDTFLRLARVKAITDSSKSTIWRWIRAGKFPRPIVQDGNTVLWSFAQVKEWQERHLVRQQTPGAPSHGFKPAP